MSVVLPIFASVCLVMSVLLIALAVVRMRNTEAKAASILLALDLDLKPVSGSSITIYGGTYGAHPIALAHVFVRDTLGGADARRGGAWKLRLAMGLLRAEPLDASVSRASARSTNLQGDFEADFTTRNPGNIGPEGRAALSAFARVHGHVSLSDRPQLTKLLGGGPVLSGSTVLIVHDDPGTGQTPEQVRGLLDALCAAIAALETA